MKNWRVKKKEKVEGSRRNWRKGNGRSKYSGKKERKGKWSREEELERKRKPEKEGE